MWLQAIRSFLYSLFGRYVNMKQASPLPPRTQPSPIPARVPSPQRCTEPQTNGSILGNVSTTSSKVLSQFHAACPNSILFLSHHIACPNSILFLSHHIACPNSILFLSQLHTAYPGSILFLSQLHTAYPDSILFLSQLHTACPDSILSGTHFSFVCGDGVIHAALDVSDIRTSIFVACMSPALNGSSVLRCFEHGNI